MPQQFSTISPYQRILVGVDNSKYSGAAVKTAAALARQLDATIVGFHVYAARLHEARFLHMEPGLPDRYSDADLQQQRSIHESLIAKGLRLISESYLDHARAVCEETGVASFEGRLAEGKHYEEIIKEARTGEYDLVALGALGLGARRRSLIGSVCERVLRGVSGDVLVVRDGDRERRGIIAAVDGSPNSYRALAQALSVGAALGQAVEVVTVYDPQFHIVAFQRLAKVLSEEAATLFRFREQKRLHAKIIDKGLEKLYRGYLHQAEEMATAQRQTVQTAILTGKPFQRVLEYVEERHPRLLVVGRFGQHGTELSDIGSTAENLARLAPCSVLVVSGTLEAPEGRELVAEEKPRLPWTPEAEARLRSVSAFARHVVREAVENYAQRHHLPEVTLAVMAEAREDMGW